MLRAPTPHSGRTGRSMKSNPSGRGARTATSVWPGRMYRDECLAGTHMFDFAVMLDLAEETVTTPREKAWKPIAEQFRWLDGSPRYDDEGYATAPPGMRGDTAPEKTLRARLREMGKYLPPDEVEELVRAALSTAGPKPWTA